MSRNKILVYVIIGVLLAIGTLTTYNYKMKIKGIEENFVMTTCKIYRVVDVGSKYPGVRLYYTYKIALDTFFSDEKYTNMDKGNEDKFIGKVFPVAYSAKAPKNSKLLITNEDYRTFHMIKPDSLHWVEQYFN